MIFLSSAVRNFIVIFLLALLGFGILGTLFVDDILPKLISESNKDDETGADNTTSDVEQSQESDDSESFSNIAVEGNTYTFAFFCIDSLDTEDELLCVYLTRINDGYKTSVSAIIPGDAHTELGGASLKRMYKNYGVEHVIKKLYYLTGLEVDDYALLYTYDRNGTGRSITDLSKYLDYRYRLSATFDYPNPLYVPEQNLPEENSTEISGESFEEPEISGDGTGIAEFISVPIGNYALHGITEGVLNYIMLLDPEYNTNAYVIFSDLVERFLSDGNVIGNISKQTKIFDYFRGKSFSDYQSSDASKYLFNTFEKTSFVCTGGGSADWDVVKEHFKALETGLGN